LPTVKIIALGDIHGNLPALEVCYEEAEKEGYDWLVHTGDVAGYGPFVAECAEFLNLRNIPGVRGNFDENLDEDAEESGSFDSDPVERALAEASLDWTRRNIGHWARRWLIEMPFELRRRSGAWSAAVYHGTPVDLYSGLLPEMPGARFAEYGDAAEADIVITGHVHRSFHKTVGNRHFINPGSVGRPRDGDPRTGFAVIETGSGVSVSFPRFEYDVDRTARAMVERGLPAGLPEKIRSGR
jgi:predicted phosphodiesterase